MSTDLPSIIEATTENFQTEVVERSNDVLVIIDFWAEWCGPCKQLGPVLEKLAETYKGKILLAKVNTETAPDLAAGFGVRSIPAVFALKDAQLVDSFVGAMPEAAIRAWIEAMLPSQVENTIAEAKALEATDPAAAEARYRDALLLEPEGSRPRIALGRFLLGQDRLDEVDTILSELADRGFNDHEVEKLQAEVHLRKKRGESGGVDDLRAQFKANPKDKDLQLKLAEALAAVGDYRAALETALDLVERDRQGTGEPARKLMVELFQLLPDDSELTTEFRRALSNALF